MKNGFYVTRFLLHNNLSIVWRATLKKGVFCTVFLGTYTEDLSFQPSFMGISDHILYNSIRLKGEHTFILYNNKVYEDPFVDRGFYRRPIGNSSELSLIFKANEKLYWTILGYSKDFHTFNYVKSSYNTPIAVKLESVPPFKKASKVPADNVIRLEVNQK